MLGLAHRGFALNDYRQHIVHTLRAAGYSSTLCGMQHVARDAEKIGYDRVVQLPNSHAEHVIPAATTFLHGAPAQPFFLDVGFSETHRSFHKPAPGAERYCRPPAPLPDTPRTRQDMAAYQASARVLDRAVGEVLDALEQAGLAENTLVICTTDHGLAFPRMKCSLTDHGIGVMLVMRGPGGFSGGQVHDGLVSQIDLFPTLCELLGIERPPWLQGRSLLPLVRGEAAQVRDELFAEVTYHAAYEPQRAARTSRWKYIRRFDGRRRPVLPNCDDGPSKDVLLEAGWRERDEPDEQLYDLLFDPNEAHNLAGDPAAAAALDEMRGSLARWMHDTKDPLLDGPVAAPAGAEVNDPEGFSPNEPVRRIEA
jgi:arylsulfatase A-like enzyme